VTQITQRILNEIVGHEGVVLETYKDSVGFKTWGVGIAETSGFNVEQYIGNPQSIKTIMSVFREYLETKYLPDVLGTFETIDLSEAQLGAALSFHWSTGGIRKAQWAKDFKAGKMTEARKNFMNWKKPPEIIPRREKERDLFFHGKWSNDGFATEWAVKGNMQIDWTSGRRIALPRAGRVLRPKKHQDRATAPVSGGFRAQILAILASIFKRK